MPRCFVAVKKKKDEKGGGKKLPHRQLAHFYSRGNHTPPLDVDCLWRSPFVQNNSVSENMGPGTVYRASHEMYVSGKMAKDLLLSWCICNWPFSWMEPCSKGIKNGEWNKFRETVFASNCVWDFLKIIEFRTGWCRKIWTLFERLCSIFYVAYSIFLFFLLFWLLGLYLTYHAAIAWISCMHLTYILHLCYIKALLLSHVVSCMQNRRAQRCD